MAKAKYQYKTDDVVRVGEEISDFRSESDVGHYGIWARKFDPERMGMGGWVLVSDILTDHNTANDAWKYYADHLRSEGALTAVLVQVISYSATEPQYRNIGKYNVHAVALDVRSSSLIVGNGGVQRTTAPDCFDLHMAINRDFGEYLDSEDQSQDDAAKDIAHNTANGTPDPTPDNLNGSITGDIPEVPTGDTGSAFEAQQNAQHTESQNGETVEHGASGRKSRKRKGDAA